MKKSTRHEAILRIIRAHPIETQEELIERLRAEGFEVTQATVSRDLRQLRLTKASHGGSYRYLSPTKPSEGQTERFSQLLKTMVHSADAAGHMVVIRCDAGMANAAAAALDNIHGEEMLGSIAGDDTVFVVMRTEEDARAFCMHLRESTRS